MRGAISYGLRCNLLEYGTRLNRYLAIPRREKRTLDIPAEDEVEEFISILAMKRRGYCNANRLRNVAIGRLIFSSGIRVSEVCYLNRNSIKNRQFTIAGNKIVEQFGVLREI